jgi:CTP:molybdopterin cytidylyltransferase MocA
MSVGVLLAAGGSTRMGRAKALVQDHGESFIAHGIRHLWRECRTVVVVLGSDAAAIRRRTEQEFVRLMSSKGFGDELRNAHRHDEDELEVEFVVNRAWRRGMLSSVRVGIDAALSRKPSMVLVLPVDHPAVRPATVTTIATVLGQALAACRTPAVRRGFSYAVVPRHRGRRGHPVAMSAALARAVSADAEARDLSDAIRRSARLVGYVDVPDPGVVRNRNSPAD